MLAHRTQETSTIEFEFYDLNLDHNIYSNTVLARKYAHLIFFGMKSKSNEQIK